MGRAERIARRLKGAVHSPSGDVVSASRAFLIPMIRWSISVCAFDLSIRWATNASVSGTEAGFARDVSTWRSCRYRS